MAVVATGFFDGVHFGHRSVVRQLVGAAAQRGTDSAIVTFRPHPRAVLQQDASGLRLLTSYQEKRELLLSLGVGRVEVVPFTKDFAALTAEEYVRDILVGRFGCTAMVFGYDNRVGSDGADASAVASIASHLGVELLPCSALGDISSTKIRSALSGGEVEKASAMLGYDYFLNGVVVAGVSLGRTIGFPTANMRLCEPLKLVPANGVYLVKVELPESGGSLVPASALDGMRLPDCVPSDASGGFGQGLRRKTGASAGVRYGMCNIGSRPTVNPGTDITIETNIFDFDEDIYGLPLRISFLRRLRPEIRFTSIQDLRSRLVRDKADCLSLLGL